jgi:hypothetical protein
MLSVALLDLTFKGVVSNIPHDAGALLAYGIIFLFVGLTVIGSRRKKESP